MVFLMSISIGLLCALAWLRFWPVERKQTITSISDPREAATALMIKMLCENQEPEKHDRDLLLREMQVCFGVSPADAATTYAAAQTHIRDMAAGDDLSALIQPLFSQAVSEAELEDFLRRLGRLKLIGGQATPAQQVLHAELIDRLI